LENIELFSRFSEMNYEFMELSTAKRHIRILEEGYNWASRKRIKVKGKKLKAPPSPSRLRCGKPPSFIASQPSSYEFSVNPINSINPIN
jgi:hypothetical protein